jgi:hypothetical protein
MSWNDSVEAHRFIWIFVRSEHFDFATDGGTMTTFYEGGKWRNDFIVGAVHMSPEMTLDKARAFSKKFNIWLLTNFNVDYEQDVNPVQAISELAQAFAVPNSTLDSIGAVVDNKYKFPSEEG